MIPPCVCVYVCVCFVCSRRMLADAHAQLEREAEARNRLEDNMKRAFMRGASQRGTQQGRTVSKGDDTRAVCWLSEASVGTRCTCATVF